MEEEDKPRPAANEEEAPQESADPPEAEKANETPSTELKRWAHPFLHRKTKHIQFEPQKIPKCMFLILATWWQ